MAHREPVSIHAAVYAAAEVIEHLLDRAVARITGLQPGPIPPQIVAVSVTFGRTACPATEAERRAAARAAGVSGRDMEALEAAPGLPQSLLAARQTGSALAARAATLMPDPIWRLAGLRAASSQAADARAEAIDAWLRSTVLLTSGRVTVDLHSPRPLWILVHGEAAAQSSCQDLAQTASRFSRGEDDLGFLESYVCLEHALRLGLRPDDIEETHPLAALELAGTPRYGFAGKPPSIASVPADFRPHVLSEPPKVSH